MVSSDVGAVVSNRLALAGVPIAMSASDAAICAISPRSVRPPVRRRCKSTASAKAPFTSSRLGDSAIALAHCS
jgi:hypothetical protein